jgi:hypothetical protein
MIAQTDDNDGKPMPDTLNVLILGASYGSLLASKLLLGGHNVRLVCLPEEATLINLEGFRVRLPVKLKVHSSVFVPLAKWAMLLAGNYRCVTPGGAREINRTVHDDLEESRLVYDFVVDLCVSLGAAPSDMVPFDKYAAAAQGLLRPSSAARAQPLTADTCPINRDLSK